MSRPLNNYLRRHRRRVGFTQDELAYLLGCREGSKVCRYERFARQPTLSTALACEAVFQIPSRELFAGLYQQVERRIRRRAKLLQKKLDRIADSPVRAQKLSALRSVVGLGVSSKKR